jgi:hypothetical protein
MSESQDQESIIASALALLVGEKAVDVCVWDVHFTARACVWM